LPQNCGKASRLVSGDTPDPAAQMQHQSASFVRRRLPVVRLSYCWIGLRLFRKRSAPEASAGRVGDAVGDVPAVEGVVIGWGPF
jgi:hypothetical protein